VVAVARREIDRLAVRAREPERRPGLLHRLVVELDVLSAIVGKILGAKAEKPIECFPVFLARLVDALQPEDLRFDRRDAAADAELEAAAGHLVEHADLVVETVGVVPRQAEGEAARAQLPRALEHRRQHDARRAVDREGRALVLGDQIGVEARVVGRRRELELVPIDLARAAPRSLDPVEQAEAQLFVQFHTLRASSTTRSSFLFWSASLTRLPATSEPNPHCGLTARLSIGMYFVASSILRSN